MNNKRTTGSYKMIFRIFLLGSVASLISTISRAQQDPIYSQFMYNGLAINPAIAGSAETLTATAIQRQQWVGIQGAPETQTLNVDAPINGRKIALGLSAINDKIGVTKNFIINGQYAYRLKFEKSTLSLGIQAGLDNYTADYTSVSTDPQNNPDNAFGSNVNRMIFNFGTGVYYYSQRFYVGISMPHILNQSLDGIDQGGIYSRQYRHYFAMAGYVFDVGENFKVRPSTLIKLASGAPVQVDVNSNFWFKETYCLGFTYRTKDSFSTLIQIQLHKQLRFGYAYDYLLTGLRNFSSGNHELMVRFQLVKKNSKILTPRYF